MAALRTLIDAWQANGVVITDAGNGTSYPQAGRFCEWTEEMDLEYGDIEMKGMEKQHISDDGFECDYESDWITTGDGDNPYRYKIYF